MNNFSWLSPVILSFLVKDPEFVIVIEVTCEINICTVISHKFDKIAQTKTWLTYDTIALCIKFLAMMVVARSAKAKTSRFIRLTFISFICEVACLIIDKVLKYANIVF
jgi:hypothetical protein